MFLPSLRWCISHSPRSALLRVLGGSALLALPCAHADSGFQSGFLRQVPGQPEEVGVWSLSKLTSDQALAPGVYRVSVQVNLEPVGQHELDFQPNPDGELQPCLAAKLLGEWGLRLEALANPDDQSKDCLDLTAVVPGAQVIFSPGELHLGISIPQIAMRRDSAGQVDPSRWESGINAAFISYQASTLQGNNRYAGRFNSGDLYLNTGVNLGEWRLRSTQSWRHDSQGGREWTRVQTFAQRDIPGTRANMTLGETFTDSDVFRSVPISGVRVASDMSMLADNQRGYAPIIRGVAQSRAKVEVWQNGYPIYSTYVSAGPYAIDDLSTAGSGELEVVLTEADGQVRRFIQPFSTINSLMRPGVWRYSATLGRYNPSSQLDTPLLWQGTLALGTQWNTTLYGGLMASEFYRAGNLGLSKDLGNFGALAFDVTQAFSTIDNTHERDVQGTSYALKYGKAFTSNTNLRFAGYRYSTQGYRDFDEALRQRSNDAKFSGGRRSRLEASVHQSLGRSSSMTLTLSHQDYWQRSATQRQYQFNFNTHHRGVSYSLFASQSLADRYGSDRQFGLSVSMPLHFGRPLNASFGLQHNARGHSQRTTLSGNDTERALSYSASLSRDESDRKTAALSLGHQAPYASLSGGITEGSVYRSLSLNASGAVLLHADGLAFGRYLGDTAALVEVPGVADVGLQNAVGTRTDAHGYALLPHLQPYRANAIVLETDRLDPDVQIDNGTAQVVPRRGAVVKRRFEASRVSRLVLTLHGAGGQPLPFGAQVLGKDGEPIGMVGQAGVVMLTSPSVDHPLLVSWGDQPEASCQLHVDPLAAPLVDGYRLQTLTCI
ncbi:fimbria/pilus outer membrane usher protein [Pseudomonas sp. CM27]|uniref:fimbria/pilus outer membrane usher protein n=1 Tax=Pseudomonas sp. CM27 TaxID=2738452 RepID=UPI001553DD02|nr:fimbria/pilus outer membrane usher protein [Pseudomonas sp. CM27]NQD74548.1 fimbrial biogenesis outer membrane usher protein [Pseudomonas sp. CM27]